MDEKNRILQHAAVMAQAVDRVALLRTYGSYSARNPALGKMNRCPHCRARRRGVEVCCSAKYTVENKGLLPRVVHKRKKPRLSRKRPPLFGIYQLLVDIENDRRPDLENVRKEHLPGYVEKLITDQIKEKKRTLRKSQKESRRTNRF